MYDEYPSIEEDAKRYLATLSAAIEGRKPLSEWKGPEADLVKGRMPENSSFVTMRIDDPLPPSIVRYITREANLYSQFQGLHIYSREINGETFLFFQHMTCLTDEDVRAMIAFCIVDRFFFRTKLKPETHSLDVPLRIQPENEAVPTRNLDSQDGLKKRFFPPRTFVAKNATWPGLNQHESDGINVDLKRDQRANIVVKKTADVDIDNLALSDFFIFRIRRVKNDHLFVRSPNVNAKKQILVKIHFFRKKMV